MVRVQVKWIGEEDGYPMLHCVFHNITDLKETQLEMNHLVNSIPGGIAATVWKDRILFPLIFPMVLRRFPDIPGKNMKK